MNKPQRVHQPMPMWPFKLTHALCSPPSSWCEMGTVSVLTLLACLVSVMPNTPEIVVPGWLLRLMCCYSPPSLRDTLPLLSPFLSKSGNGIDNQVFSMQSLACADAHSPLH